MHCWRCKRQHRFQIWQLRFREGCELRQYPWSSEQSLGHQRSSEWPRDEKMLSKQTENLISLSFPVWFCFHSIRSSSSLFFSSPQIYLSATSLFPSLISSILALLAIFFLSLLSRFSFPWVFFSVELPFRESRCRSNLSSTQTYTARSDTRLHFHVV